MRVTKSPARRRMIEVVTLKDLSPATQENYQRTVSMLSRDCGRATRNLSANVYATSTPPGLSHVQRGTKRDRPRRA